ncbi:MAG: DNA-protecting protein DprA [Oscillospiraceae bacterium]|nr:DNA-protecting protein DprA [Oscillospiraceae bacterium]
MKVAIVGSRSINNISVAFIAEHLPEGCNKIISGGARGVDSLARQLATKHNIPFQCFLPSYTLYGKAAPIIRNSQIVQNADFVLVFWDGKSKGSAFVIKRCQASSKPFKVIECWIKTFSS